MPSTQDQVMWPEHDDVKPEDHPSSNDRPKKPRHRHAPHQLALLNELYEREEHPSLEERTSLAQRLGMETKTVNAWFQNKRASNKKRNRPSHSTPVLASAPGSSLPPSSSYELPPIASLLAPSSSSSSPSSGTLEPEDSPELESRSSFAPPRLNAHPSLSTPMPDPQQSAFYAGNPTHKHSYESANGPVETTDGSRPKMRARPSALQTDEMRKLYTINPHPTREEREALCARIGMRYQSVTNWFQNQRSLAKRRQEEQDARAAAPTRSARNSSKARRYSPFPPATEHPSISALLNREASPAPSLTGSVVSSRGSPYPASVSAQRPRRSRPAPHQLAALKKLYRQTPSPSIEERSALAAEVGIVYKSFVADWTSRKRKQKWSDDDESVHETSSSSSQHDGHETDGEDVPMDEDEDARTDDEYDEEAVTPPLGHSPSPSLAVLTAAAAAPRWPIHQATGVKLPVYGDGSKHGVRVEDALLLLSFHNTIVA
ncbi:hypothetical protein K488DRAFT_85587 [Vararia minispora EC-137]|uniref:Uncharacterized protein n=1 Tax=Vararia minispora EC-137 TaxID=1314806 RepID=A0ACB8QM76_9AGAM|nr:hypothetical protein K488DRAFT_85587 [Vararia minispora EC-137]